MTYTEKDVTHLYLILGEAVWYLQHLENVMITFNTMTIQQKRRDTREIVTEKEINEALDKERKKTLGPLIKTAKYEKTIPVNLIPRFDSFLKERNWIIHKCVIDEYLSLRNYESKQILFKKIEDFIKESKSLKEEVLNNMKEWFSQSGYDLNNAQVYADKILKNAEKS